MREISCQVISDAVAQLCIEAACNLGSDVQDCLVNAKEQESSPYGRFALEKICANIDFAREEQLPLCQDTGLVLVFASVGQDVHIVGGTLQDGINAGVAAAYTDAYLRKSMVGEPLFNRLNTNDNTPALIHTQLVAGEKLRLVVMPKGAGSENMSALAMLKPAQGLQGVIDFVVGSVKCAGGNPCPPIIVGVGIGGNAEFALELSKRALCRRIDEWHPEENYRKLEEELLNQINNLGIGPQGFGGNTTALAVHVEHCPTHIAMLPVGVTINCHVARHKEVTL